MFLLNMCCRPLNKCCVKTGKNIRKGSECIWNVFVICIVAIFVSCIYQRILLPSWNYINGWRIPFFISLIIVISGICAMFIDQDIALNIHVIMIASMFALFICWMIYKCFCTREVS